MAATEYLILGWREEAPAEGTLGGWVEADRRTAYSAGHAVRQAVEDGCTWTRLVAVPARSWRPLTVQVQTVMRITVGAEEAPS
jgi:hypothetical protein